MPEPDSYPAPPQSALPGPPWLLANPTAGRGLGQAVAQAIAAALTASGKPPIVDFERADAALPPAQTPAAVIVVGGDGTLRAAVQRILELYGNDLPPILPVPMGTANLMGQYLGLQRGLLDIGMEGMRGLASTVAPVEVVHGLVHKATRRLPRLRLGPMRLDPQRTARRVLRRLLPPVSHVARDEAARAVRALERGEIHAVDVGSANGAIFLLMAGIGFDAHIVHALDQRRSGPIGLLSYALPAASAVARYGFPPMRVDVDGRRVFGPKAGVVMVANLPQYGTGFPIVPGARGDDRLLDVLCLPCRSREKLLRLFALATDGRHLSVSGAVRATGKLVEVTSPAPVPVQIDGDPGGRLPLTVKLLDRQVPFIRPYP